MKTPLAVLVLSLMTVFAASGCGNEQDRPQEPLDNDVSVDEQMSPASENRPAGIGREDTSATPGTETGTEQPEDQAELRDRMPPDG